MTVLMDFAMVPPEINSGLMYAGPGSAPTLALAGAWDGLAAELRSAAASFGSVVSNLAGEWQGTASQAMLAAAQPHAVWMNTAAAQAEQTAAKATAWAEAYDAAYAMTVPPPLVAANRAQLSTLIATNIFGQNTSAIMATEAQYEEMWAQDAAAMNGYAGSAAAAATLTPFTAPASATGTSTSSATGLSGLVDSIFGTNTPLGTILNSTFAGTASSTAGNAVMAFSNAGSFFTSMAQLGQGAAGAASAARDAAGAAGAAGQAARGGLGALGGLGGAVSAGLGRGAAIGQLSVPPSWAVNPAATPFEPPLGFTPLRAPKAYAEGMPGMPMPGGMAVRGSARPEPEYGFRLQFMAHPPAAG